MSKPKDQLLRTFKTIWKGMTTQYLEKQAKEAPTPWQREAARQLLVERKK